MGSLVEAEEASDSAPAPAADGQEVVGGSGPAPVTAAAVREAGGVSNSAPVPDDAVPERIQGLSEYIPMSRIRCGIFEVSLTRGLRDNDGSDGKTRGRGSDLVFFALIQSCILCQVFS